MRARLRCRAERLQGVVRGLQARGALRAN
jgi:hypothetical protein